jgi:hypothetical protein
MAAFVFDIRTDLLSDIKIFWLSVVRLSDSNCIDKGTRYKHDIRLLDLSGFGLTFVIGRKAEEIFANLKQSL